jgi:hypothetical protein
VQERVLANPPKQYFREHSLCQNVR